MKREEHKTIVNQILGFVSPEHQATASELLSNLSEDYEKVLTESEGNATTAAQMRENNEKLRAANTKLFLRMGEAAPEKKEPEKKEPEQNEVIPFASLFNEKGELK